MSTETSPVNTASACADLLVCRCLKVTEEALVTAVQTLELHTIKEVRRHTGAGDGCTACHKVLRTYLEPALALPAPATAGPAVPPPEPRLSRMVRDRCCLRYRRKGTKCSVCPLRPENGGPEGAADAAACPGPSPTPAAAAA